MSVEVLDVGNKESGKIFHRKPHPASHDGLLISISHAQYNSAAIVPRNVRFLHSMFDTSGDRFIAGDQQGNIFMFDFIKNRFSLAQKTGSMCTALSFTLRRRTEFLVALADYSLKCFDTDSKELVAWMKGHDAPIHTISLHASGRYAITSSNDVAQLWDLDTFKRKRKLNIKENVGIIKVFFVPLSNTILTCFKGDTIFAWEADTLNCKYQLPTPPGDKIGYKAFAITRDGRIIVAGGKSNFLHLWSLETQNILRIIELPQKFKVVKQLEFLPDNFDGGSSQMLGVLRQDGIMSFVNVNTYKVIFDIGSVDDRINSVSISPAGRHIVAVMDSGKIKIYDVPTLTTDWNKPPPPLVKVIASNKMADRTNDGSVVGRKTGDRSVRKKTSLMQIAGKKNDEQEMSELPEGLDMSRLRSILRGYGEYPAKYRMFIWRSILRLPENHTAYAALVDKGTHPCYANIHQDYPIKSGKLLRILQRTLSAFAHWAPIFGETKFLPLLTFPFVKLFQHNQLVCFEIVATLVVNWCQHWFEYFPNPPVNVLGMIENVISYHDKKLLQHLVACHVTSQTYAWPLLETMFSEVFTRDEWLKLFDNIFSNHPTFMLMVVAAYCMTSRGPLTQCSQFEDFEYFFHHRNAVSVDEVITEAYRLMATTPLEFHPKKDIEEFLPLTKGQYPVFNKYPKFIVDYQVKERERLRQEEVEYLRQRQVALELQRETEQRAAEEENWYRQQELLLNAEKKRRKLMQDEEEKLADQRTRLQAMNREVKMKELQLLDAARRRFMHHQQQLREAELCRMDDDIEKKHRLRDVETQAAVEEANIRNLELQIQKKLFEQELHRNFEEAAFKDRTDFQLKSKQEDIEDMANRTLNYQEQDLGLMRHRGVQTMLAKAGQVESNVLHRSKLEERQHLSDLDREEASLQLSQIRNDNRQLEEEINELMKHVASKKAAEINDTVHYLSHQRLESEQAEKRRKQLHHDEKEASNHHLDELNRSLDESMRKLNHIKQRSETMRGPAERRFINDTDSIESSTQFSLDRGRQEFERGEQDLMKEIRRLREKLAREGRETKIPRVSPNKTK